MPRSRPKGGMESVAALPYAVVSMGQELAHDSTSIGTVALAILKRECNRFLALSNEVAGSFDAEAIHQMRVTTRRIQVATRCFRDNLPERYASLRDQMKPVFGALGEVRDLDVDIEHLVEICP